MADDKSKVMYFGGGFETQPDHKKRIVPYDLLCAFYNTDQDDEKAVWDFANKYNFGWYLFPDKDHSTLEKFAKIQERYHPILKSLVNDKSLNRNDIEIINKDLEDTSPAISFRGVVNDLDKLDESFCLYVLTAIGGEEPECTVERKGSLEFDQKEKTSAITITMKASKGSKSKWYMRRVPDGIKKAPELFPSEAWEHAKNDLRYATFTDGYLEYGKPDNPATLCINLRIGKVNFTPEELSAHWNPTTGNSFIAKRIWDWVNCEYIGYQYNICKNCGKMHNNSSKNYCDNPKCQTEWDAKRKKINYDLSKKKH